MCVTNEGTQERGRLSRNHWYTIDRITLKMSDGKRVRRYAVCVDGRWNTNQWMTLKDARKKVECLKKDYLTPVYKPVTKEAVREYARKCGNKAAYNLMLLGGYGFMEGNCRDYDELLEEFRKGV